MGLLSRDGHKQANADYKEPERLPTWSDVRSGIWERMNRQPLGGWGFWVPLMLGIVFVSDIGRNAPRGWTIILVVLFIGALGAAIVLSWRQRSGRSPVSLHERDYRLNAVQQQDADKRRP